ncbi:hypothetical protein ACOKS3_18195 [Pseudomonas sp. HS6-2]|jgi:hypothetical protein|uniref:hypothetical protein n=1 Tax=Pseudomonas sp. HS6-2 TaxID=3410986 RepID=UPI003BCFAF00
MQFIAFGQQFTYDDGDRKWYWQAAARDVSDTERDDLHRQVYRTQDKVAASPSGR